MALLVTGLLPLLWSPPTGWIFLQLLSWLPAFWVFSRLAGMRAFVAGLLVGTLANLSAFYWISDTLDRFSNLPVWFGWLATLLVALVFGLYVAVFAWGFHYVREFGGRAWPFAIAAWFSVCEFLNPQLFPYYQGVGWYQFPYIYNLASLTGVSGISFLVILCNALLLQLLDVASMRPDRIRVWVVNAGIFAVLLALTFSWSAYRLDKIAMAEAGADTLRIALIQPNIDSIERKRLRKQQRGAVAEIMLDMSRRALQLDPAIEVLVWPENILGDSMTAAWNQAVVAFARQHRVEVWTGKNHRKNRGDSRVRFNSALRIDSEGRVDVRYDKMVLLPFGEFMPLKDVFPSFGKIKGPGALTTGQYLPVYETPHGARFSFLICYEAILNDLVAVAMDKDINLLVNLTNDSWFGDSSEPYQHLMLTTLQAVQYGVPVLRSTTTGISAVIDASGALRKQSALFEESIVIDEIKLVRVPSPYSLLGDWFAWMSLLLMAGLLYRNRKSVLPGGA